METHDVIEATVVLCNNSIVHGFQLVNKQVDILCDGILGRDFLQRAKARIYDTRKVMLNGERCEIG
jgi:hypothetical protein